MSDDRTVRLIHGLRVRSELPLAGTLASPGGPVDLEIATVEELPQPDPGEAELLSYDGPDGHTVRASITDRDSILVSFSGRYRYRISADHHQIEVAVHRNGDPAMADVLLQGWVMAMTLMIRGMTVLHATAVQLGDRCIALLGDSGMGKSTIAALLLHEQATLVTDDVLRIERLADERGRGSWVAHRGLTALRLRGAAAGLADGLATRSRTRSADDRLVLSFDLRGTASVDLAAVLVPFPSRVATALEVRWLDPPIAVVELNRYQRVYEWKTPEPVRRQFETTAELATDVPVGLMMVPWGPPWPSHLRDSLLASIPPPDP